MPMVDVLAIHSTCDILDRIPTEKVVEKKAVPVGVHNETLYFAVADSATFSEHHHFAFITKLNIKPVFHPLMKLTLFSIPN
jgi:hypothetical protein